MDAPPSLATLSTFLHSEVCYTHSANTINEQGLEYIPPTRMSHTYSYLNSYFRWKTPMKKLSDTGIWAHQIKDLLTTCNIGLQGLQPWSHLLTSHQRLLLLRNPNSHTLLHQMRSPSTLNLLYLPLYKLTVSIRLQLKFHPMKPEMKPSTKNN